MYNRNRITTLDPKYEAQQKAIKTVCNELGLIAYLPNYHAAKNDSNTVLVYSKAAAEHNARLDEMTKKVGYVSDSYLPHICWLENSDANGRFDLNYMNYGVLDLRDGNYEDKLRAYIKTKWEEHLRHCVEPRATELHKVYSGGTEC